MFYFFLVLTQDGFHIVIKYGDKLSAELFRCPIGYLISFISIVAGFPELQDRVAVTTALPYIEPDYLALPLALTFSFAIIALIIIAAVIYTVKRKNIDKFG